MIKILSLLLIITPLLAGCYSDKPIMTFGTGGTRYVVHDLKGNERGNILLKATNKGLQGDLVYRGYEKEISKYLLQNGFKTTTEENEADYVGFINYGFLSERKDKIIVDTKIKNKSIYFETQDLEITNPSSYENSYGGYSISKGYKRILNFRMFDLNKDGSNGVLILDSKIDSVGVCDKIGAMRVDLTTMMFKKFPGKNDKVEKITIPALRVNSC
jgi:hypothetical protein